MNWTENTNGGAILEDDRLHQAELQPAAILLREVFNGFVGASARFYKEIGELPFIYRERQVQAELLPAIHTVADVVLVEQLVDRKRGRNTGTGWVDYVVRYQKQFVFFIELKFAWVAVRSAGVEQTVINVWDEAHDQLEALDDDELLDFAADLKVKTPGRLFKMALLIVPGYQSSNNPNNLQPILERSLIEGIYRRLVSHLADPEPNLSYTWALPGAFQKPLEVDEDRHEIFPCVSFVAEVVGL